MQGMSASEYKAGFIGRVRAARTLRFPTTTEIATALGIAQDTYKIYETKTFLAHEAVERFCMICGVSVQWLMIGKGPGPSWQPFYHQPRKRKPKAARRRVVAV